MSSDWYDSGYDDYLADQGAEMLYQEHRAQAIEEFTIERLQSFYNAHPDLAGPALRALAEARRLSSLHPESALVFAAIAMELGIKTVLLKPVVHGLVHQESTAALITDMVLSYTAFQKYRGLLFQILSDHGGIDLRIYRRPGSSIDIWAEVSQVLALRNAIVHRGETVDVRNVDLAVATASTVMEVLIPEVLRHIGLHLHDGRTICGDALCRVSA